MPNRIIHICGGSGVGKKTLIKSLIDDSPPGLRARFGIDSEFGAYGNKPLPGFKPICDDLSAPESIVVHFWQHATHDLIAKTLRLHPEVEQRIYVIWRPYDEHIRFITERVKISGDREIHGYRPDAEAVRRDWKKNIVAFLQPFEHHGIAVEVVDASRGYERLEEWPD